MAALELLSMLPCSAQPRIGGAFFEESLGRSLPLMHAARFQLICGCQSKRVGGWHSPSGSSGIGGGTVRQRPGKLRLTRWTRQAMLSHPPGNDGDTPLCCCSQSRIVCRGGGAR